MTLNPHPLFPSSRCYVLKLHRDALPREGRLAGRLEHVATGDCLDFSDGAELLERLCADLAVRLAPLPVVPQEER